MITKGKVMKRFFRILLLICSLVLLLTGCTVNNVTGEDTTEITDAMSSELKETTGTQASGSEKQYANYWSRKTVEGVSVRTITVDSGKGGDEIRIVQLTDIHINYCTPEDLNDPVLKSTYDNRTWLKNFAVKANLERCLNYAKDADQIVITGDIYDYLSQGAIDMAKKYIFDSYSTVMACLGNHESVRKCQGKVDENTTYEDRMAILSQNWINDIYYASRVIEDKAMVIVMDNGSKGGIGAFHECQVAKLDADLKAAREKGYSVFLFYHIPISTGNVKDRSVVAEQIGDKNTKIQNFYTGAVGSFSSGASGEVYDLIVNNGDIIKGTFCGHHHNDFYTEIKAKTASGEDTVIPQYVVNAVPYGSGNVMEIIVK